MIPKRLHLSGFLSYQEPAELDFTNFELACISGSNGAGKSSVLDAITWALFGQARRRDDAIINSHCNSVEVIYDFYYESQLFRVQRSKQPGKTPILEFFIDDGSGWRTLTEHTLRDTEARIEKTLRLDYETFINASFFLQGKADQFAQQRPSDRKRILSSILGLEVWETYRERSAERRRACETDLAALDRLIAEIDAELNEEDDRRERLKSLETTLEQLVVARQAQNNALETMRRLKSSLDEQRRLVDMLNDQMQAARLRMDQRSQQLEARQTERQQYQQQIDSSAEIEAAYRKWQQARSDLERWEGVAANFRQYESQLAVPRMAIETERTRYQEARKSLLEQQAEVSRQEQQIPSLEASRGQALESAAEIQTQLAQREMLETEQQQLQESHTAALAENMRMKAEMSELKERIDRLHEAHGADCPLCGQPLSPDERAALIERLEAQGKDLGARYRANQEAVRAGEERRRQIQTDLKELQQLENGLRLQQRTLDQLEDRIRQVQQYLEAWQTGGAQQLADVERLLSEEDFAQEARAELARINAALQELGYDAAAHENVRRVELEGRASEEHLRRLETAKATLAPLDREIESLVQQTEADRQEVEQRREAHQTALEKYEQDSQSLPDIAKEELVLFDLQEQENRTRMQVGAAMQQVSVLKDLRARRKEKNARREELTHQIAKLKTLERAFGKDGVPALLIEQALPEIESQANDILDRLTVGGMSVRFSTQKDYKDKNRDDKRETLDILISDAAGWREYEMFSGGEAFRVDFAIRLALSRVLAQRSGARLQMLVIDEGFGSQDAEGRQRLIEAINLVRPDFAKILVITHLEELKDAFSARVEVEKNAQGSQVRVVA
jgi:exonuclease SbcC